MNDLNKHTNSATNIKVILLALLFGIHLARYFSFLAHAQIKNIFEDGFIFISQAWGNGIECLWTPYQKYFHTLQRLVSLFTTLFPLDLAPYFFGFFSLLFHFAPVPLIISSRTDHYLGKSLLHKFLFALVYLLLPVASETYGTLTNIHWYLQIYGVLIFFALPSQNRLIKYIEYILIIICSLTGITFLFIMVFAVLVKFIQKEPNPIQWKILAICVPGSLIQMYGILFIPANINIMSTSNEGIQLGQLLARLYWNNIIGMYLGKFTSTLYNSWLFILVAITHLSIWTYLLVRIRNAFWLTSLFVSLTIFAAGVLKTQSIIVNGSAGTRYSLLFTWVFLSFCLWLGLNTANKYLKWLFIFTFCLSMILTTGTDFKPNGARKEYWHAEVLKQYYTAEKGDTVRFTNASMSFVKRENTDKPFASWQRILLKNECLWQNNETLSTFPDTSGFEKSKAPINLTLFTDSDPIELELKNESFEKTDSLYVLFESNGNQYSIPMLPIRNKTGYTFLCLINKRALPRHCHYKISIANINQKKMYCIQNSFRTFD